MRTAQITRLPVPQPDGDRLARRQPAPAPPRSRGGGFAGGAGARVTLKHAPADDARGEAQMLLNGVNHVAILTHDTGRLAAFYREVFDAEIGSHLEEFDGAVQLTFIRIGQTAELNVFQVAGNTEADRQSPMFGRGRIDHLGLQAASLGAFDQIW